MKRVYTGVFLISMSALTLEITLTRIISVKLWYHFSYLIISMALLGYGAAGAHLAVSKRFRKEGTPPLATYAVLFSIMALVAPLIAGRIEFKGFPPALDHPRELISLTMYYLLLFLPFYFSGMVIGMALKQYRRDINRLYFYDLIGAGLGCFIVVYAIGIFGGPGTLALVSSLAALSSLIFTAGKSKILKTLRWVTLVAACAATFVFAVYSPNVIKTSKGALFLWLGAKQANKIPDYDFTEWGALTRLDVTPEILNSPLIVMVGPKWANDRYKLRVILQDLQAITPMYKFSGDLSELPFLPHSAHASAYLGKKDPEALVIGSGGGSGVMVALSRGAKKVTAVEINPLTCKVVSKIFADFNGGLFNRPDVELVNAEGRSYLARSDKKFDVIEITLVDTFAALSSGAYSLSESYLYTVEAFEEVFDHLKEDGVLTCTRLIFDPPRESLRVMAIAIEALKRKGVKDPSRHIYVIDMKETQKPFGHGILLLKRNGFSREDAARVNAFCVEEGYKTAFNPYDFNKLNEFSIYARADDRARKDYRKSYRYNVKATFDDAPFFFQYFKWEQLLDSRLWDFRSGRENLDFRFPLGHLILLLSIVQVSIFSVVFILWPLRRLKRKAVIPPGVGTGGFLLYFAALGTAYIAVEIVMMQKLMVFLGYPLRSLTVVLFSLLLSSGVGSSFSRRWKDDPGKAVGMAILAIAVLIPVELVLTEAIFPHMMGWPSAGRFAVAAVAIFPMGFAMGMPFPLGLGAVGEKIPDLIPWYWGINACFSVISSLATVVLSMTIGYRVSMLVAGGVYVIGYMGLRKALRTGQ